MEPNEWERDSALLEGQRQILAMIHRDVALPRVLEEICLVMEAQADGMLASVLLLD